MEPAMIAHQVQLNALRNADVQLRQWQYQLHRHMCEQQLILTKNSLLTDTTLLSAPTNDQLYGVCAHL
jgi:hypothetical protein